jgi:hypothetical protein
MKPNKNLIGTAITILITITFAQSPSLEISKISPRTTISVVKRVEQEYYLLTKDHPLVFNVEGPHHLRVYMRLLWTETMSNKESYKLIIKEDNQEKILNFTTELSTTARGANNKKYSKWRSFYLEIPQGRHEYKISLLEAKSDTLALRFSFEKPREYRKILPEKPYKELQFVERERIINYYELPTTGSIKIQVEGPAILKVSSRLNYDYTMEGKQTYTLVARVGSKEWQTKTFNTSKSETGIYKNAPMLIPSRPSNMYLNIPPGSYRLEFVLKSTLAQSGALTFYYKPKESYE